MSGTSLGPIVLDAVALDCVEIRPLADFYMRLLGWVVHEDFGEEWMDICPPGGGVKIAFQQNEDYVPPVWPEEAGAQQQMVHLDFAVGNVEEMTRATEHAVACGATLAPVQYGGEKWVTLFDPAGHPFCFVIWG